MKMLEYGSEADTSDRSESDVAKNKEGPPKTRLKSAERAMKSANQKLHLSTRQKNLIIWYGYNEYMSHHYEYMTNVAEVRELESYTEAAKVTN